MHAHLIGDPSLSQRFHNEAKLAGSVNHPNIINVQDFGLDDFGNPYIVMDYASGQTYDELLGKGKLPLAENLEIFIQICDALAELHSRSIIHRDLKPSNIMIVEEDGTRRAKLVDFGIAKVMSTDASAHRLTLTGEVFGSPPYMSPEQCLGQRIDHLSDMYSLGCVMYDALTGGPPFSGDSVYNIMWRHVNEPTIPACRF